MSNFHPKTESSEDALLDQPAVRMEESPDPPFQTTYKYLLDNLDETLHNKNLEEPPVVEECQLPLIDLSQLSLGDEERQACKKLIGGASQEWGFFQVINHGIPDRVLERMRAEQVQLMKKPFLEKTKCQNFTDGTYRWGAPSSTSLEQLSWSEAFQVTLNDILDSGGDDTLGATIEQFMVEADKLAHRLAGILTEEIGRDTGFFKGTCLPSTSYLRLNRYPPCPIYHKMSGLISHTDSDFLTVLHQDNVGGLQLMKDGRWIAVKPNTEALIINIGDLFQAWSNDVYKSVEHRAVANAQHERFSIAYFFCPSYETVIHSDVYRSFSYGEFKKQVQEDAKMFGRKIGLPRFAHTKEDA